MVTDITWNSVKGSNPFNEDGVVLNERCRLYGVIDGATSLLPYNGPGGKTAGALARDAVCQAISGLDEAEMDPAEALKQANRNLDRAMSEAGVDLSEKMARWRAAAALVKVDAENLRYAHVADCFIFVRYATGFVRLLTYPQTLPFEKKTEGVLLYEGHEQAKKMILANQGMSNAPGGYGVLNGEEEVVRFIESGSISAAGISQVLIISDGLIQYEPGATIEERYLDTAHRIFSQGPETHMENLIKQETSDPDCVKYPRFKMADDKTYLIIDFREGE